MHSNLTEEEMRRALFGELEPAVPAVTPLVQVITSEVVVA